MVKPLARPDHGDHVWIRPRRSNNPFLPPTSDRKVCQVCGIPQPREHVDAHPAAAMPDGFR